MRVNDQHILAITATQSPSTESLWRVMRVATDLAPLRPAVVLPVCASSWIVATVKVQVHCIEDVGLELDIKSRLGVTRKSEILQAP